MKNYILQNYFKNLLITIIVFYYLKHLLKHAKLSYIMLILIMSLQNNLKVLKISNTIFSIF